MTWSVGAGRYFGISVRVHLAFLLFIVLSILEATMHEWPPLGVVLMGMGMLFVCVLLHEFGHCWGARRVGGTAEEVLLWPLGGLAYCDVPMTPRAQMATTISGPAVNVILLAACGVGLVLLGEPVPWNPHAAWSPNVLDNLFRINLILLVFNLLPAYPLDGGRIFQCLMWPRMGFPRSTLVATTVGKVIAVLMFCYALVFFRSLQQNAMLLLAIAILVYWQCENMRRMVDEGLVMDQNAFGYDFSQGYTSLNAQPERRPSWWQRWKQKRQQKRQLREEQQRQQDERRVDEILNKLHRHGMDRLTPDEKSFLTQVSAKYRERQDLKG